MTRSAAPQRPPAARRTDPAARSRVRAWDTLRRESVFTAFNLNIIGLSAIQLLLRDWWGAFMTILMLGVSTGIRVTQELLAARRIHTYLADAEPRYTVQRDGQSMAVARDEVVRGDVLIVGPGDHLLADGMWLGPRPVTVDESPVTGAAPMRQVAPGERLLGGSYCVAGRGAYLAEAVGDDRQLARQHAVLPRRRPVATPLERVVARTLQVLLAIVAVYAAVLLADWARLDMGATGDLLVDAAPVIFSIAPTGLYLMIIVTYITGTADLANRGALVRNARSVESLAETSVVCFTDLGILAGTSLELTPVPPPAHLAPLPESTVRQMLGDAARSLSAGGHRLERVASAFEGERRGLRVEEPHLTSLGWSAVVFDDPDLAGIYVLGERDVLSPHLVNPLPATFEADADTIVLAYRPDEVALRDSAGRPLLPSGLIAVATVHQARRLRPEAMQVVRGLIAAGIRIKAFSPGSPTETLEMLHSAGLSDDDVAFVVSRGAVSRATLEARPREEWAGLALDNALFGGLSPEQVGEVVHLLRASGETVAVIGDGVRDLPALKAASLPIAQPSSTQAALDVSSIVLLSSAPDALLQVLARGQSIIRSLVDVLRLNLTMVTASAFLIVAVRYLSQGFPYVSSHGSVINIATVTIPSLALSLVPPPHSRQVSSASYSRMLARFVLPAGLLLGLTALAVYVIVLDGAGRSSAQQAVAYTLVYAGLLVGVLTRRTRTQAGVAVAIAAAVTLLPLLPWTSGRFRITWLPEWWHYPLVVGAVVVWLIVLQGVWWLLRRLARRPAASVPSGRATSSPRHEVESDV